MVIAGPSGVGKGTVVRELLARVPEAVLSVSATTRAPRANEVPGESYHFLDHDRFEELVRDDGFLEHAEYAGNRYGTPRAWVEEQVAAGRLVLLEIEVQGALQVRESSPDAVLVFLEPPGRAELRRRLVGRGTEDEDRIARRLEIAEWELAQADRFDHRVVNDDVDRCVDEILAVLASTPG